jgi:hypothetical protein
VQWGAMRTFLIKAIAAHGKSTRMGPGRTLGRGGWPDRSLIKWN